MTDKRKAWREQEQRVVDRWNAATAHYRELHAEFLRQGGTGEASGELGRRVERARAEVETVRREVARLKVAFSSGKRY